MRGEEKEEESREEEGRGEERKEKKRGEERIEKMSQNGQIINEKRVFVIQ